MSGRVAAETKEGMRLVEAGMSVAAAARQAGIARSTLIRALGREGRKAAKEPDASDHGV